MDFLETILSSNYVEASAQIFTAIITIGIAWYSIRLSNKVARNTVKPLLSTITADKDDVCYIKLTNYGMGPAIINNIEFKNLAEKKPEVQNSLYKVFPIERKFWSDFIAFLENKTYYISAGETLYLAKIKKNNVESLEADYEEMRNTFNKHKSKISIKVYYADTFNHKMKPFIHKFY